MIEAAAEKELTPLEKLRRDVKKSAEGMTTPQARYLVDAYYSIQNYRKISGNQVYALGETKEPHEVIDWLMAQMEALEGQIRAILDRWSDTRQVGKWTKSITGIGPVISSGLLAYIDITKAKTAGAIWLYAGLQEREWISSDKSKVLVKSVLKGAQEVTFEHIALLAQQTNRRPDKLEALAKDEDTGLITPETLARALSVRPWNAELKVLCWKIGESFVKVSTNEKDVYGKVYIARKVREQELNEAGAFADQAKKILETKKIGRSTDAYKAYITGKLPPAHIQSRAKRYAVKLFLAHFQEVAYFSHYGVMPPKPYMIEIKGHAHYIAPPNMNLISGFEAAHNGY